MAWSPSDITALVRGYAGAVARANGSLAQILEAEGGRIERAMIESLSRGRQLTVAEARELRAILRRIVAREAQGQRFLRLAQRTIPDVAALGVRRVVGSAERILGRGPRVDRILDVSRVMQERLASRRLVATEFYARRWATAWTDRWTERADAIADAMRAAAVRGADYRSAADAIEAQLEGLTEVGPVKTPGGTVIDGIGPRPIRGQMHRTPFARGFARTAGVDAYNRAGIEAGQELGLDNYVNIGNPGPTQSDICYAACQAGAMTLAEWDDWRRSSDPSEDGGRPTRHVWNCNCSLHAVPREARARDWRQPNPDLEERMAA